MKECKYQMTPPIESNAIFYYLLLLEQHFNSEYRVLMPHHMVLAGMLFVEISTTRTCCRSFLKPSNSLTVSI